MQGKVTLILGRPETRKLRQTRTPGVASTAQPTEGGDILASQSLVFLSGQHKVTASLWQEHRGLNSTGLEKLRIKARTCLAFFGARH